MPYNAGRTAHQHPAPRTGFCRCWRNAPSNNRKTLLRLMSHHAEDGVYTQGYQKLADLMGVEYSYISKLCWKLSQQGFITRLDSGPSRSARWRLNAAPAMDGGTAGPTRVRRRDSNGTRNNR